MVIARKDDLSGLILRSCHILNEVFHPFCTLLPHMIRYMTVSIQCKRSSMVAQVFLNRFYIISILQGQSCIGMPEVMKAKLRSAHLCDDPFKTVIDSPVREPIPKVIGKHQRFVDPLISK